MAQPTEEEQKIISRSIALRQLRGEPGWKYFANFLKGLHRKALREIATGDLSDIDLARHASRLETITEVARYWGEKIAQGDEVEAALRDKPPEEDPYEYGN